MFISVIICTRNRANSLPQTLESLFCPTSLESLDWEVVVVDNDSTDHTAEVCQDFRERFPRHFRFLSEKKHGKSNALNVAIAAARGDILAFTDDDVLCAPDYLMAIRTVLTRYPADGVQGCVLLDCEGGSPEWLDSHFSLMMALRDCSNKVIEYSGTLFGCNIIVRAGVFQKIGGFRPELGPGAVGLAEDTELTFRMRQAGCRLIYAPQILVWHRLPRDRLTKSFLRRRAFQDGRSRAYFEALPVPLWRFTLYVVKEWILEEVKALRHVCAGRPALALRCQCEARTQAGFLWQHWQFKRGVLPMDRLSSSGSALRSPK
jgi:glycosyltransferase involved in cell wall biosynthesis